MINLELAIQIAKEYGFEINKVKEGEYLKIYKNGNYKFDVTLIEESFVDGDLNQ